MIPNGERRTPVFLEILTDVSVMHLHEWTRRH